MKTLTTILSAVVLAFSFSSCAFYHNKYEGNAKASAAFLTSNKTDKVRTNVEGVYYAPDWKGIVVIKQQEGGKLVGLFPHNDTVKGIVSGHTAYITLVDGNWTFYTLILKKDCCGNLVGYASENAPFSEKDKKAVTLLKIGQ